MTRITGKKARNTPSDKACPIDLGDIPQTVKASVIAAIKAMAPAKPDFILKNRRAENMSKIGKEAMMARTATDCISIPPDVRLC
jgi:hypothetical protein